MTAAKERSSLSLNAKASNHEDELAFKRLSQYCKKMSLSLMVAQENDNIFLRIEGQHQNMVELQACLEDKAGQQA